MNTILCPHMPHIPLKCIRRSRISIPPYDDSMPFTVVRSQMEAVVDNCAWPVQDMAPGEACTRAFLAEGTQGVWPSCEMLLRGILEFEHK